MRRPALLLLIGLATLAPLATPAQGARSTPAAPATLAPGVFFAERIDASPLPLTDRVTDEDGTTYLVEFDRLVLSLRAGNRFRAAVRFRRTLHSRDPRGRDRAVPIQSLTVDGTYEVVNGEIRFTPDPSTETRGLRMLSGRVQDARRLSMPFDYRNGTVARRRTLQLVRQNNVF